MITTEKKQAIITDLQKAKNDTGSSAVQVGILTARINELTDKDSAAYLALIKKLGIRR